MHACDKFATWIASKLDDKIELSQAAIAATNAVSCFYGNSFIHASVYYSCQSISCAAESRKKYMNLRIKERGKC